MHGTGSTELTIMGAELLQLKVFQQKMPKKTMDLKSKTKVRLDYA